MIDFVDSRTLAKTQDDLEMNLNEVFDHIHPVGSAKRVTVHEVKSYWKTENPKSLDDLEGFVVRYTIYWEGPIEKDGYTKLISLYDAEVGRYTETNVIKTNGITKQDAMQAIGAFLTACLDG